MALKTIIDNITAKRREYDEAMDQLTNNIATEISTALAPFVPPGYALSWTQYTPHFNDGSPCRFSVHDPYLTRKSGEEDKSPEAKNADLDGAGPKKMELGTAIDRYGKPNEAKTYQTNDYSKPLPRKPGADSWRTDYEQKTVNYIDYGFPAIEGFDVAKLEQLNELWGCIPQSVMERAFGDHCEVLIYPDGTYTNDSYSHD